MGVASTDASTGKPIFNDSSTTQADLQAAADYAASVGNSRRGTTTERNAALSALANGFMWADTTDNRQYKKISGAWVQIHQAESNGTVTPGAGTAIAAGTSLTLKDGRVTLVLALTFSVAPTPAKLVAYIPAGFRPPARVPGFGINNSGAVMGIFVEATGDVLIYEHVVTQPTWIAAVWDL